MTLPPWIWLPGVRDHLEHAALDTDVVRAGAAGVREVVAVCSASVVLCSLATPANRRCPDCASRARRGDQAPVGHQGLRRRLSWGR